ncbi:hypothetical protein BGZ83_000851 [Gryganskiella cystojenkinii]|nr:hypothetical protein BGZ83_000851 [Gryganskiella cystojenkinii]
MTSHPPPIPNQHPSATITYKGTGQTIALDPGTIVLGRGSLLGILSAHVSRKQGKRVIVTTSPTFEVSVVRHGTNRSLLNGKELLKDVPTTIHDGDLLTLLETEYPISFEINRPEIVLSASKHSQKSSVGVSQKENSLPQPLPCPPQVPVDSQITSTTNPTTVVAEATAVEDSVKRGQDNAFYQRVKVTTAAEQVMDLDEQLSETTSDSAAEEERYPATEGPESEVEEEDYISDESSIICEDLSDLESSQPHHHPHQLQRGNHGVRDSIILD